MARALASLPEGPRLKLLLNHIRDLKNGSHCLFLQCLIYTNGVRKLNTHSYQWINSIDVWPEFAEKEISTTPVEH